MFLNSIVDGIVMVLMSHFEISVYQQSHRYAVTVNMCSDFKMMNFLTHVTSSLIKICAVNIDMVMWYV